MLARALSWEEQLPRGLTLPTVRWSWPCLLRAGVGPAASQLVLHSGDGKPYLAPQSFLHVLQQHRVEPLALPLLPVFLPVLWEGCWVTQSAKSFRFPLGCFSWFMETLLVNSYW